jgi:putative PIN family toxin of toxin-antitoxin system
VRVVLDTNVFVSGIFFSGPPSRILRAWRDGKIKLVVSAEILEEYRRVGEELASTYPGVDLEPFLALLAVEAEVVLAPSIDERISEDQDDDKFIFCALAAKCNCIVSGDIHLKEVSGYRGIEIVSPRKFIDRYLKGA